LRISVFGSTGSIGLQALEVAKALGYGVHVLAAGRSVEKLLGQIAEFKPRYATMGDQASSLRLKGLVAAEGIRTEVLTHDDSIEELAGSDGAERVINAVVGSAGLRVSLAALKAGKDLALANKESMVAAGQLMVNAAKANGASILPVDSEHSAIWQCLWSSRGAAVDQIILTASGGPFRGRKGLSGITPQDALKHPTWNMGAKITIDSATLINKALEVIEARWLFDVHQDRIRVVVHPQSVVHSAVMFSDGSMMAQMGMPDMKLPIMAAMAYPGRSPEKVPGFKYLDLPAIGTLTFEEPDPMVFPGVRLGHKALDIGGLAPCAMSAANESAVSCFLEGRIAFSKISELAEEAMETAPKTEHPTLEDVLQTDSWARRLVESRCAPCRS